MIRGGIRRAFQLGLRGRARWEREVEDEIRLHLALRAEQLVSRGASADDAYREAIARFGPLVESRARLIDAARHREQRMQRTEYFSDLRQDIGFALRTLGRQKGWTTVTIFTFALGIAASTAVFSVVSRLMLHAVDYPHADRVVEISQQPSNGNTTGMRVAIAPEARVFRAWRDEARDLESVVGYEEGPVSMRTAGEAVSLNAARVVPALFGFTGHRVIAGRQFTIGDIAGGENVVVIGESFWRQRLGSDPAALGKRITLNDSVFTIVGVAPAALALPGAGRAATELWLPLDARDNKLGLAVMGRLRPGATIARAESELDTLYARTAGFTGGKIPFTAVVYHPSGDLSFHDSLIMLMVAVGLVLLIACTNVAHLLIARGAARQRELAIRAALGAGRSRLLRQLITESLVLSGLGSALGVVLGWLALKSMVALRPSALHALSAAHLDATTLGVALIVTVASGIAFGLIGALQSRRHSTNDALKTGAVGRAPAVRARIRGLMIVTEMGLSATLLVGATMVIRSVVHMQRADLGFDPVNLYQVPNPFPKGYGAPSATAARSAFLAALVDQLRHAGGVRSVTVAMNGPESRDFSVGRLEIEGEPAPPPPTTSFIDVNEVDPDYFATMGIALARGSTFTDTSATTTQVIVNKSFAAKHWPNADAIGHRVRVAQKGNEPWHTIVGVADDASTGGVGSFETGAPLLYAPLSDRMRATLLMRTTGDTATLSRIRATIATAAQRRMPNLDGISDRMSAVLAAPRYIMLLLALLTLLALALASVGLYGVMAFVVTQQTREIGIRVALGASRGRVARAILSRGTALAAVGAAVGLVVSRWGTRLIENQLFGVTRSDPASFVVGALVLMSAALLACVVPTRRALAVDPMTAIRAD